MKMTELNLHSSFEEILGANSKAYSLEERKKRWFSVMALDKEMSEYWNNSQECYGCKHLDCDNWCSLNSLPCTVNPVLTFEHGIIGLACMGGGFEPKQLKIDFVCNQE